MTRKHIVVHGQVQGVGFRYYVQREAERLDLAGWARNCPDGTVEIEAQGDDAALESFLQAVRKGPAFSRVGEVEVTPVAESAGVVEFRIRYY